MGVCGHLQGLQPGLLLLQRLLLLLLVHAAEAHPRGGQGRHGAGQRGGPGGGVTGLGAESQPG